MAKETGDVIIVGAGLAGLACAQQLRAAGVTSTVLEASDGVGGRVRTDVVEGFQLDRGFQVILTAYPECQAQLDMAALSLAAFRPGALVRFGGRFHRVSDPFRRPTDALATLVSPIGTLADKLRVARLRADVRGPSLEALWRRPETSTLEGLARRGFGPGMIDRFFRPFFGGILLDHDLTTSSRMFEFIFRMLSLGDTAVPRAGMGAIGAQLATGLPIELGVPVARVAPDHVVLAGGAVRRAAAVVVATDGLSAARLVPELPAPASRGVTCLYYAAERDPVGEPTLVLDGEGRGPANNFAVMSHVAPAYAPPGATLCSVTVLGIPAADDAALDVAVRAQLTGWFGAAVARWRHLRTYRIPHAQPAQPPGWLEPPVRSLQASGCFVAGDHRTSASLEGALRAGREAARQVGEQLCAR